MLIMEPSHLFLQTELRQALKTPIGRLIRGSIESTSIIMKKELSCYKIIVGVGDVTAEILVNLDLDPDIIITDGKTKRTALAEWKRYPNFTEINAICPAAEITKEVWVSIREASKNIDKGQKTHILVDGEEDLLVLPLLLELPDGAIIVYGMPDAGAVLGVVNEESRSFAQNFMSKMSLKSNDQ